jgi:hypothetical protein
MKRFVKWLSGIIVVLLILWLIGPKPSKPEFNTPSVTLPSSLTELETQITNSEKSVRGVKPDNEARIIWADTSEKEKTKIAILYLHGFGASQAEGEPVHRNLAKRFNANLYLTRLHEHGIDRVLDELTSDKPVSVPVTNPIGCNIKWEGKDAHWMPPEACDLV